MNRTTYSLTFLGLLVFGLLFATTENAQASFCITPEEAGAWHNNDAATRGVTHLDFRMECRDASETHCDGDICSTTSAVAAHYFISVWGSCHPTDCVWGEVEGRALSGNLNGWYYFLYDPGFAKEYVYVRTYPQWPGWLRVWIYTDFVDPNRADQTSDDWFIH